MSSHHFPDASRRPVVVLGASTSPDRFSHRAVRQLADRGFPVLPVNPAATEIAGIPCNASLLDLKEESIDTITLYVSPAISSKLIEDIVATKAKRVIANPGAENSEIRIPIEQSGAEFVEACTLVLLESGSF